MKYKELRPILWSDKFFETLKFYTEMLGFTVEEQNDDWGWASLHKDGVEFMIAKPNKHAGFKRPVFTGSFYITTDDVDQVWEQLKDKVKLCYKIENFEWGCGSLPSMITMIISFNLDRHSTNLKI